MEIKTALTYDDVLLVPQKSDIISRQDVDTSTRLTKNISLKIPILSANMDTVTESEMAIAMSLAGGIGIVHRFCDIATQAKEVAKVKRKQNIIIDNPFIVSPDNTLAEVREKIKEYNCKSFLVTDDSQKLLGILTPRDITFIKDHNTLVKNLMTPQSKLITAQHNISPENAKKLMLDLLDDEQILKSWFGCFATRLDQSAEQQLPVPLEEDELIEPADFINELKAGRDLIRDACCRFAYQSIKEVYQLYINGCEWETSNVSPELINHLANNRILINSAIAPFLDHEANQILLYDLWKLQWIQFLDD